LTHLASIRQALQEGFFFHITKNELLSEIFDLDVISQQSENPLVAKEARKQAAEQSKIKVRVQQKYNDKQRQRKVAHVEDLEVDDRS